MLKDVIEGLRELTSRRPLTILLGSHAASASLFFYLYAKSQGGVVKVLKRTAFKFVVSTATLVASDTVNAEKAKLREKTQHMILRDVKGERYRELPERGMDKASLAKYMQEAASKETKWQKATISGTVYHSGQEIREVICDAFKTFIYANPLHPDCFPAVRKMEAEVVQMCVDIFKGGKNACGTMTSGGTESIIMAIKAYRDWAREVKGIMDPEIIKPTTAHAAFDKGCHYLGVRLVEVPVDPVTCRVKVSAVAKALNRNTIMVVGSAISYPHGVMDDILSLAELTKKHGCGLHVDNCLGSLLLPFLPSAGYKLPPFDFSVEGVTSLSCDTHKYGFAPKGSSVILYANQELRHHQYFVAPDWPGGIYATPSMGGLNSSAPQPSSPPAPQLLSSSAL